VAPNWSFKGLSFSQDVGSSLPYIEYISMVVSEELLRFSTEDRVSPGVDGTVETEGEGEGAGFG
jgi:hypothetical protein